MNLKKSYWSKTRHHSCISESLESYNGQKFVLKLLSLINRQRLQITWEWDQTSRQRQTATAMQRWRRGSPAVQMKTNTTGTQSLRRSYIKSPQSTPCATVWSLQISMSCTARWTAGRLTAVESVRDAFAQGEESLNEVFCKMTMNRTRLRAITESMKA